MSKEEFVKNVSDMLDAIKEQFREDFDGYCPGKTFDPEKGALALQEIFLNYLIICYAGCYAPYGDEDFLRGIKSRCRESLRNARQEMGSENIMSFMAKNDQD